MSLVPEARRLLAAGLSVIPILPDGSKRPLVKWEEYQHQAPSPQTFDKWLEGDLKVGLALVCGEVSGNVEVIDFDDMQAFNEWRALLTHTEAGAALFKQLAMTRTPGPGIQVGYRCQNPPGGSQRLARRPKEGGWTVLIETRGEGGYAIIPPTPAECHPNHRPYELLRGDLAALPVLIAAQRDLLLETARSLNEYVEALPPPAAPGRSRDRSKDDVSPGEDYNRSGDWRSLLTKHGWVLEHVRGEHEYWRRPGKDEGVSATLHVVAPGILYVFSTNAAPFEAEKSYDLFGALARLEYNGDFSAAARGLRAHGFGSVTETVTIKNPGKRSEGIAGIGKNGSRPEALSPPLLAARLKELDIQVISEAVLANTTLPEPTFVVDGVLPIGYTLLASKPKIGKTRGVTGIAHAVAIGGKAFGKIDVRQGEVLFLAMESDLQDLQGRLEDIRGAVPPSACLQLATTWPSMAEGGLDLLEQWLTGHPETVLVIVDTVAKIKPPTPRNADLYAEDYRFGAHLKRIADTYRIALLGLHHQRKAASEDTFDTISGTLGVTAACDAVWVLQRTRGQADAVISMTGRRIREQEIAVRQDEHVGTWTYLGDAEEFRRTKERADVVKLLQTSGPMKPAEIAEELKKNPPSVRQLLRRMVQAKEVTQVGKGRYTVWVGEESILGKVSNALFNVAEQSHESR